MAHATVAPTIDSDHRAQKVIVAAAGALIVLYCAIGISIPAGLGWDFANFYDAGHRFASGHAADLYQQERSIEGAAPQGEMRFWSAPLSAVLLAPLSLMPPRTALVAFKIENTLALFAALGLWYWHCRRFVAPVHQWNFAAAFAVMALMFQPFWTVFRVGGQTTPSVLLLLVLALLAHSAARWTLSAFLLGVVVMLKPSLLVMLAALACLSGASFLGALVVAGLSLGLLSIAVMGWPIHLEFIRVLIEGSQTSRPWVFNSSLYVPLENLRLLATTSSNTARMLSGVEWLLRLGVVGLFGFVIWRSRRHTWRAPARHHFEFLMALCFWLLFSLLIWEHYLAALFLPLAYFTATRGVFSGRAQMLLAAMVAFALGQNLIPVMYVANRFAPESTLALVLVGLFKAAPLILLLALLLFDHRAIFETYQLRAWTDPMDDPRTVERRMARAAIERGV